MSTWKKVALYEDIGVFAGGGSTTELGGSINQILLVGNNGDFGYLTPGSNTIIVGEGGVATNYTFAGDGDVIATFDTIADDITLNLGTGVVDTGELAAGAVKLSKIADSDFDDETTGVDLTGAMLYWDASDNASLVGTGGSVNQGYVLTVNASGLPEWAAATATDTIDILDGSAATDADFGLLFGSEAALGGLSADKVYTDGLTTAYNLSYNPFIGAVTQPGFTNGVYTTNPVGNNDHAALYSKNGFAGDLRGTASAAKAVEVTSVTSGTYFAPMTKVGDTTESHGAQVYSNSAIQYSVNGAGDVDVTINGNLTINGNATKVEIESAEVQIADFRILLAHSDADGNATGSGTTLNSDQVQTAAAQLGVGILIDNANQTTERNLARFAYRGRKGGSEYTNSNSVMGWVMAQEADNTASVTAPEVGVGAMSVNASYTMTTTGGGSVLNFGVGAMGWFNNGLWIQTAI